MTNDDQQYSTRNKRKEESPGKSKMLTDICVTFSILIRKRNSKLIDWKKRNVWVSESPGEMCNTKAYALSHFKEPGPLWDLLAIQVIKICSKFEK